ncbi:hypothetical protein J3R74_002155 [Puniceicoccus vermicola]
MVAGSSCGFFVAGSSAQSSFEGTVLDQESPDIRLILLTEQSYTLNLYYSDEPLSAEGQAGTTVRPQGPIVVGGRGLSQAIPLSGSVLFLWAKDVGTQSGFRMVAKVTLESENVDQVVLLLPENGKLRGYPIDASEENFKGGATLFFNTLDVPIAARFNDDVSVVYPFKPLIVEAPEYEGKSWYGLRMYEPVEGGGAKIFCSGRWPFQSHVRVYNFIYRNSTSGRIDYRAINEFR